MSRREIKIDVWKYIHLILMGLSAVLEKTLEDKYRALRPVLVEKLRKKYVTNKNMLSLQVQSSRKLMADRVLSFRSTEAILPPAFQ